MKDKPLSCLKKMYNLPDPSENYAYYRSVVRKQTKKSSNCIPMFGEHCILCAVCMYAVVFLYVIVLYVIVIVFLGISYTWYI